MARPGVWSSRRAILGVWRIVLWYHGRSMVVPWYCQDRTRVPGAILSIETSYTDHPKPKAECRKAAQSHPKATSKPVGSQAVGRLKAKEYETSGPTNRKLTVVTYSLH